jgi:imidazolonepropionase-like amidohydrolase
MRTAYIDCRLFDGADGCGVDEHATIIVEDATIAEVRRGPDALPDAAEIDEVFDAQGAFVMPGMINAHAHHFGFGKPSKSLSGGFVQKALLAFAHSPAGTAYLRAVGAKALAAALYSGVTTERGVGDFCYTDVQLRDRINQGALDGPRFLVSGPAITCPSGHGAGTFAEVAVAPEEFEALVDERAAHHVDFIKITVTGGVMDSNVKGEAGVLRMTEEQTRAACDRAAEHGLYVASHTEGPEGVKVDLDGGVYTVEHGSPVDAKTLAQFKSAGAADICTIAVAYPLSVLPTSQTKLLEAGQYNAALVRDRIAQAARQCREAGIPVGIGSDAACPYVTHYDLWRDVLLFSSFVGASPAEALRTVTLGNARIIHADTVTGSIEAGKDADFIVLGHGADPLSDLRDLRRVETVVARGRRFERCPEKLEPLRQKDVDAVLDELYTPEKIEPLCEESAARFADMLDQAKTEA